MNLTARPAGSPAHYRPRNIAIFLLVFLAGCGLAMDNEDRLDRAEQAFEDGKFRAAIIDAKDVLLDDPENVRARLLLGRSSVVTGDGAAAEKELRRAIELGTDIVDIASELGRALLLQGKFDDVLKDIPIEGLPSSDVEADVHVIHGDASLGLNQPQSARAHYSSALELRSDDLDALLGIVSSFVAEENIAQARGGLEQLLQSHSDSTRVWLYSGGLNARSGDTESAEANFKVALDLATTQGDASARVQALTGLAESLLEQNDAETAREHIDTLAAEAPQAIQTKLLVARIAFLDQDWKAAQQNLQQVLQVAPNYTPAKMLLGAVQLRSGNLAQAEMYLSSSVASMPDNVWARQLLAETRLQLRRADDAQQALEPIVGGPDADPLSLQMAARASFGREKIDEALEYLRRSVDSDPNNPDLRFQLAVTLLQLGRIDEAKAELGKIDVSDSDENAFRRDALGVLAAMRDSNSATAIAAAKRLVTDYGDRAAAYNLLGAVEAAAGDRDNAAKSFENALEQDPKDVTARRSLAEFDAFNGDLDSATRRYNAILADDPDAAWAMFALGSIAVREENYEDALRSFQRAAETDTENAGYRLAWARTAIQLEKSQSASEILEKDMEMTLGHIPSGITLGVLKAKKGDRAGAFEIAAELQQRHPTNPASFAFEGEIHLNNDNPASADLAYDKAVELGPVQRHVLRSHQIKRRLGVAGAEKPLLDYLELRPLDNGVRSVLAESYMQADDIGKSIAVYERVADDEPTNAIVLNNLAWSYYLVDDPRALETAQRAHDAMPDNGAIVDTLGWVMIHQGSVEKGEKILRRAVEMENGRPEIRYHHAVALARLNQVDQARSILDEILAGDTEFASREDAEILRSEL